MFKQLKKYVIGSETKNLYKIDLGADSSLRSE